MSYTQIDNSYRPLDCISFSSDPLITIQTTKLYPFLFVVQLQSYSHPDYYIGIRNGYEAYIVKLSQPKDFHVVSPGLCGLPGTISFQSVSIPSNYLRQRFFVINEDPFCNSTLYKRDACFYQRRDEWFLGHDAFESVAQPGYFIYHQSYRLKLALFEPTPSFIMAASFRVLVAKCQKFQSYNIPSYYWTVHGMEAYVRDGLRAKEWIIIRPGLTGEPNSVSFRSCTDSTMYLRHQSFLLWEHPYQHSVAAYRADATYFVHSNKWFNGYDAYESCNYPQRFIRHQSYRLQISQDDGSLSVKKDGSFKHTVTV